MVGLGRSSLFGRPRNTAPFPLRGGGPLEGEPTGCSADRMWTVRREGERGLRVVQARIERSDVEPRRRGLGSRQRDAKWTIDR
jgi:hypothetical protein